jgi:hypothetical protein
MVMKEPPMSADIGHRMAQRTTVQIDDRSRRMEDMRDLALRQWCIEKAVSVNPPDVVKLARDMFDFITAK